ncbi:MAG: GntR family transcriptional regulator [Hyphomicrobiales bacterium]
MSLIAQAENPEVTESLTSQVYGSLRGDIIEGELAPGTKLKVEQLRRRYEVGASPVREALSMLASDGLVDRIDQRGFRVAIVSEDDFADILKSRCWLEERALRESIAHGDAEWEEGVVLSFYRLSREDRSIGESGKFVANPRWEGLHKEFHYQLIAACGSPTLLEFCDKLYERNIRYRNLAGRVSYPKRKPDTEHEEIMQAALDRDADLAAERLVAHYQRTGVYLQDKVS